MMHSVVIAGRVMNDREDHGNEVIPVTYFETLSTTASVNQTVT